MIQFSLCQRLLLDQKEGQEIQTSTRLLTAEQVDNPKQIPTKAGATRNRHPFSQQDSPFSLSLFPSSTTQKIGILIPESNRPESPL
jgi:hypothetical protein